MSAGIAGDGDRVNVDAFVVGVDQPISSRRPKTRSKASSSP
jgi:hypothetical protein